MNGRVGLRVGSFIAAAACAVLVACGGGGGGGGGGVTPSTPTPTPVNPTTQSTTAPLSTSTTTPVSLGGISNGSVNVVNSATFTLPAVSVATNATIGMTSSLPTGVPAPASRTVHLKKPDTLGVPATAIAYFTLNLSVAVTISQSPAFSISLPSAPTGNCYVVVYDPLGGLGTGWQEVLGPITCASTMSFPAQPLSPPLSLAANDSYVFAIVTTGTNVIPTPTSSATTNPTNGPTASPTGLGSPLPAVTENPQLATSGWTPYQVATALKFPVQSGYDGAGQTIAIVGSTRPKQSDLTSFLSAMQIHRRGSYIVTSTLGEDVNNTSGGLGEATLDVETVLALAPGANVEFVTIPDLSGASFQAFENYVVNQDPNNPTVVSMSFGGCEDQSITADDVFYKAGAAKGMAFTISSGDQGDACYFSGSGTSEIDHYGVNSPASDPYVVAVGGNETQDPTLTTANLLTAMPWNDTFFGSQGAAGGGISTIFQSPSPAQATTAGVLSTGRNVPDISMPAVGVSIFLNGNQSVFGGTSWSAPEAAALIAEMYHQCPKLITNTTTPASMFYAATYNSTNFVDETSGNITWNKVATASPAPPVGTRWAAKAGYDQASGLGLPLGTPIVANICPGGNPIAGALRMRTESLTAGYGPSRNVDLVNAVDVSELRDMGPRAADATTTVWLTLRPTGTLAQDAQTVTNVLQGAGLHVHAYPSNMLLAVEGPTSAINAFFQTEMHNLDQGNFGARYANVKSTVVPAAIAPFVQYVLANNMITRKPLGGVRF